MVQGAPVTKLTRKRLSRRRHTRGGELTRRSRGVSSPRSDFSRDSQQQRTFALHRWFVARTEERRFFALRSGWGAVVEKDRDYFFALRSDQQQIGL